MWSVLRSCFNPAPLRLCVIISLFALRRPRADRGSRRPGSDAQWATAGKQGVGTRANLEAKSGSRSPKA